MNVSLGSRRRGAALLGIALLGAFVLMIGAARPAPTWADDATDVAIGDTAIGQVLVDHAGMTLYTFTRDTAGVSNCSGGCATAWPPVTVEGDAVRAPESIAANFSVITRADGAKQAAYNGLPLYRFAGDTAPGQTNGEGSGGVWYVARP